GAPEAGGGTMSYGEAVELAQFNVAVDGEGVTLEPDHLKVQHQVAPQVLRVSEVSQLQALVTGRVNPAIAWPQGPVELLPDRGGSWTASVDLADGRRVWLALVPRSK
ncbi:MAG: hypothetical protein OER86_04825, partial [Phycisphaerae bacterium]|nr:hypothetical protein [Phycisphaerae bacterium]